MMTLWELKKVVDNPRQEEILPTAKHLKESGIPVVWKKLSEDAWIAVYQNGYALYQAGGHSTVFPIHPCGDYMYMFSSNTVHMPAVFFDKEPWYTRLILEGEDRLGRNQDEREQGRTVSYSAVSEEWEAVKDFKESTLEFLIRQETVDEVMQILTGRQRRVLELFFLQEKSQKQISKELNISRASVYAVISQAVHRIRENYPAVGQHLEKAYTGSMR